MKQLWILNALVSLAAVAMLQSAAALDAENLYRATVVVADRSAGELKRGAVVAFGEVLVKLTGDRGAASGPAGALRKRASQLLLQYTYRSDPRDDELLLVAEFDERAVAAVLQVLGVRAWGKERPDTLVWLIVDRDGARELVSGDEPGVVGATVLERAARRGIPVLLPLIDIEESQHLLSAGDWPGITSAALALSARYRPAAALIGHIREDTSGYSEIRWLLQVGQENYSWQQESDIVDLMLDDGIDTLGDALARRFADPLMLAQADHLGLRVLGITTAEQYARVTNYLGNLDTVANLFVSAVSPASLELELTARGGRAALTQSIAFGQILAPVTDQPDSYRLVP